MPSFLKATRFLQISHRDDYTIVKDKLRCILENTEEKIMRLPKLIDI